METQEITPKHFKEILHDLCMTRIIEAVRAIESLDYIERDRGLYGWESNNLESFKSQLKTNEEWIIYINPSYTRIQ